MSIVLHINRVKVGYLKDGSHAFGIILHDDFEYCNVLDFDDESAVPKGIQGIVKLCRDEYHVNGIDLLERCAEEGHPALLDGQPVEHAELVAVLAETRDN